MKYIILCWVSTLLLATQSASASAEAIKLRVAYSSGAYSAVLQETARQFEAIHPDIKIEYVTPIVNTYDELLQSTLRSALTGRLPDISLQGSQNVGILAQKGIAVPLNGRIRATPNWPELGYSPSIADVGQIEGKTYALAYATSVPIVYLNLDLLQKAGVNADTFTPDWDGLTDAAAKVSRLGGNIVGGLFDYNSTGNWTFQALITSQNGKVLTEDGTRIAFLDSTEGLRALEVLRKFGSAGTIDLTQTQMLQAFASGTVGVFASYSAALGQIEKQVGSKFKLQAVPWPILADGGRVPAGGRVLTLHTTDASKQNAAWEYAKFLTGPVGQTILVKGVGAVPVNDRAVSDVRYLGSYYDKNPQQKVALETASRLTAWPTYPGENSIKVSEIVRDHLRRVLVEREDPAQVLRDMKNSIQPLVTSE